MIINKPHLKEWYLRLIETVFSLLIWSVVLYLFAALLTIILWVLGISHIAEQLFIVNDLDSIVDVSITAFIYTIIVLLLILGWIRWNLHFYGGLNRRKARPAMSDDDVAALYKITINELHEIKDAKVAYILPKEDSLEIEVSQKL